MAKPEYRVILQKRDLDDEKPKWKNEGTSNAFSESTMRDYDGLAIDVFLEGVEDRIKRDLSGNWP